MRHLVIMGLLLALAGCQVSGQNDIGSQMGIPIDNQMTDRTNIENTLETQPADVSNEVLAQCLTEKGVVMYGTLWCSHCNNQKSMFGDSFKYIDFIDCDQERQVCSDEGVRGYPTWIIAGRAYSGEQTFEKLKQASGCR
ncbi:hypothetical protein K9M79_06595 [Candidatus Woesearchaeota archaeon]|nr:hypothetical protein [Candidatus Woesearchaeota archaeon]